jgi:hypothetical protein
MNRAMPEPQRVFPARITRQAVRVTASSTETSSWWSLLCQEPHLKQGEIHLRLLEVDTPEVKGVTRDAGIAAKAFTQLWLEAVEIARRGLCSFSFMRKTASGAGWLLWTVGTRATTSRPGKSS